MKNTDCKIYRVGDESEKYKLSIADHILDNIYGQIGLTDVEKTIERLPIFKRLHDISQLGLVNWVFPCALHTRYTHSVGVMHIAGEMAQHININMDEEFFDDSDIQIIRLAGMLHDIGHYPMSHNVEQAYRDSQKMEKYKSETVSSNLKYYCNCPDFLHPAYEEPDYGFEGDEEYKKEIKLNAEEAFIKDISGSTDFHHENIGYQIIINNKDIFEVVKNHFVLIPAKDGELILNPKFSPTINPDGKNNIIKEEDVNSITNKLLVAIGQMIRGNYNYNLDFDYKWMEKYSAMIQLIHSDLDADNLDYLLRDATFSGTSYGIMDMSMLLNCLVVSKLENDSDDNKSYRYLVGIQNKGIGCVEQFLLNKFLAYSQMILTKYVSNLEAMLLRMEAKYIIPFDDNYSCDKLKVLAKSYNSDPDYLNFSDYYVRNEINRFAHTNPALAKLPRAIISHLRNCSAMNLAKEEDNECICTAVSEDKIREEISNSEVYKRFLDAFEEVKNIPGKDLDDEESKLFAFRFESYTLSKQIPLDYFIKKFLFEHMANERLFLFHYYRLGTGIPVLAKRKKYHFCLIEDNGDKQVDTNELPILSVDHPRSSLKDIYSMKYVSLRQYNVCDYKPSY